MEVRPGGTLVPHDDTSTVRPDDGRLPADAGGVISGTGSPVAPDRWLQAFRPVTGSLSYEGGDPVYRVDPDGLFGIGDGPLGDDPLGGTL